MNGWALPFLITVGATIVLGAATAVDDWHHRRQQDRWLRDIDRGIEERRQATEVLGGRS